LLGSQYSVNPDTGWFNCELPSNDSTLGQLHTPFPQGIQRDLIPFAPEGVMELRWFHSTPARLDSTSPQTPRRAGSSFDLMPSFLAMGVTVFDFRNHGKADQLRRTA
jgi:hypothetical protein